MSRIEDEERIVNDLSLAMKAKLRLNAHKSTWANDNWPVLLARLREEVYELEEALKENNDVEIINECADVANFCAMIADNTNRKIKL